MTPRLRLAAAACALSPNCQGNLDGLCGLYAIINAIELAIYPSHRLTPALRKDLFKLGLTFLKRERQLVKVLTDGMSDRLWIALLEAIIESLPRTIGATIRCYRPIDAGMTRADLSRRIIRSLSHGDPVVVSLLGTYDHFTVICGFTDTRLRLFDSWGYKWVTASAVGLVGERTNARHQLCHSTVIALTRPP